MAVLLAQLVRGGCRAATEGRRARSRLLPHVMLPLPPGPSLWQAFTTNAQTADTKRTDCSAAPLMPLRIGYRCWKYV